MTLVSSYDFDLKYTLETILNSQVLGYNKGYEIMENLMSDKLSDIAISAILTALSNKIPKPETLAGFSNAMFSKSVKINYTGNKPLIDIVGTGGTKFKSFNVSTVSSLVTSMLGVAVAKHGNRSSTTFSGSADLLESLGINILMDNSIAEKCLNELGITFMFAPIYHPAMKNVVPIRKLLKIKTIFNVLGPLTNPANVRSQLTGVYTPELQRSVIESMKNRKFKRAAVVYNELGADEIVPYGKTHVLELHENKIYKYILKAKDFGIQEYQAKEFVNLPADISRLKTIEILQNSASNSALSDFVCVNSAMALKIAGIEEDLKEGVGKVREILDSGKGIDHLEKFGSMSNGV